MEIAVGIVLVALCAAMGLWVFRLKRHLAREAEVRRTLEDQLGMTRKLESVGLHAGGIVHDFNNLLVAVADYADLAARQLDHDSPLRRDIDVIRQAARSAESLTRRLLRFIRDPDEPATVLDLNELVGRLDGLLRALIGGVHLGIRLADHPCFVLAAPGQIERVLLNLVSNARDAMRSGGRVTVALEAVELQGSVPVQPGPFVRLSVEATGCGMRPEVQAQAFTPSFTTKEQGTGLGLATVRDVVQRAGGFVAVDSVPGQGTTFAVYLPRAAAPEPIARRVGH